MEKRKRKHRVPQMLGHFQKAHAQFQAYLGTLLSTAGPVALTAILPAYTSQRALAAGLSGLTCLVALALVSTRGLIWWRERLASNARDRRMQARALIWLATGAMATGLLAGAAYLGVFTVSVKIESVRLTCQEHAGSSEYARDVLIALEQAPTMGAKARVSDEFWLQWGNVPPDLRGRVIDSTAEAPYGGWLIALSVLMVTGIQAGLFMLAILNVLIGLPAGAVMARQRKTAGPGSSRPQLASMQKEPGVRL